MKTYIADIIPRIKEFSQKLDNLTLLTNQHWVVVGELSNTKTVYIFRQNNELLISQNGKVERATWEYLGHNALLISRKDDSFLFKHGFFDNSILALKIDSKEEYAFLVNETIFDSEINSIDKVVEFLQLKYIEPNLQNEIESATGIVISSNGIEKSAKMAVFPVEKTADEIELERKEKERIRKADKEFGITFLVVIFLIIAIYIFVYTFFTNPH